MGGFCCLTPLAAASEDGGGGVEMYKSEETTGATDRIRLERFLPLDQFQAFPV